MQVYPSLQFAGMITLAFQLPLNEGLVDNASGIRRLPGLRGIGEPQIRA